MIDRPRSARTAAISSRNAEARRALRLDDSLSTDLARDGALTPAMYQRFLMLARYAAFSGADAILFTCSAFGPCIEACARDLAPLPVLASTSPVALNSPERTSGFC